MSTFGLEKLIDGSRNGYQTTEDRVMDVLRTAITSGLLLPGERLPQAQLAEMLDVSRVPIRAALRHLESEGLVRFVPHKGVIVAALSSAEVSEIYEMRAVLEAFAVARSVKQMTPAAMRDLEGIVSVVDAHDASAETWIDARRSFYETLYSVGNGDRVVRTIMQLRAEVGRYLLGLKVGEHSHADLLAMVRAGDADGAAAFVHDHLLQVAGSLRITAHWPDM